MNAEKEKDIILSVKKRFVFLWKNGYQVQQIVHTGPMGCWEIQIESHNTNVIFKLLSDREQIFLLIANKKENFWISLSVVLFFIAGKAVLHSSENTEKVAGVDEQLSTLAVLLGKYIEQIMTIFSENSTQYKEKFIEIRQNLRSIEIDKIRSKNKR